MNTDSYYLIGAFNSGEAATAYFKSLKNLGEAAEPIIIQYWFQGKFEPVEVPKHVKLLQIQKEYPGNTGKHKDFRQYVAPLLVKDQWCVFTDMHDVIFQQPFPEFPSNAQILVASEGKKFGEIEFWKKLLPKRAWKQKAYNVGCFAMRRDLLLRFWDYLYNEWMQFFDWYAHGQLPLLGDGESFPFCSPILYKQIKKPSCHAV